MKRTVLMLSDALIVHQRCLMNQNPLAEEQLSLSVVWWTTAVSTNNNSSKRLYKSVSTQHLFIHL